MRKYTFGILALLSCITLGMFLNSHFGTRNTVEQWRWVVIVFNVIAWVYCYTLEVRIDERYKNGKITKKP